MLTDKELEKVFAPIIWNSEVRLKQSDAGRCGFQLGAVVGLFVIETKELAEKLGYPIGSRFVDVEGPSGATVSLPLDSVDLVES